MSVTTDLDVDRPDELPEATTRPVWKVAVKRAVAKFSQDQCTDKAAALTYFSMQSLFPGLIAVLSLINVFGNGKQTTQKLVEILAGILGKSPSDPSLDKITTFIDNVNTTGGGWIALIIGVLASLWSASGYVGGFSRALNKIYEIGEGRPVWKLRPQLLLVTAVEVVLIIIVMVALVTSGSVAREIGKQIGLGHQAVQVWGIAKWPFVVFIVVFIIGMLYWATPNVAKMKRDIFSWGALFAFVIWVVGSVGLVLYVGFTQGSSYQKTYGAFAGAIIFMLWLWITNLAMLFGAEMDAELIRTRQLRAGLDAEEIVQLPARDASGLEKKATKQRGLVAQAVALRDGRLDEDESSGGNGILGSKRPGTQAGSGDRKDDLAMGRYDAQRAREQVQEKRGTRRAQALTDARAARKTRDRLERQEAKKKKKFSDALAQVKKERKAREAAVTDAERRTSIERTRAKYAPEMTPEREHLVAEHRARRAAWDAAQEEKRAKAAAAPPKPPKPPKEPKEQKPPMPSVLRDQVERDQAYRRKKWYAARGRDV